MPVRDGTVPPEIILTYAFKFYTSWQNGGVPAKVSIRRSLIPRTKIFSSVNCLNPRADNLHVAVGHYGFLYHNSSRVMI